MRLRDPNGHPERTKGGFTLIEVVVSLVILTTGILAVVSLSASAMWQTRRGDDYTNAAMAAQEVLDDLSVRPYDSLFAGDFSDTLTYGGATYRVKYTITDMTDSIAEVGGIKRIEVLAGGGLTQSAAEIFELYIFDPGT